MKKGKIIGLIGAPGSGKTTLGRNLRKAMGIEFFEEDYLHNPFAYGPKAKAAHELEVNIGFLVMREKQHRKAQTIISKGRDVIMDTVLEMTDVYAKAFSGKEEYRFFKEIYDKFAIEINKPSVLIYLYGSYDLLSRRALKRKMSRPLEKKYMGVEAVGKADKLIRKYIKTVAGVKVIKVNVAERDIRTEECAKEIAESIKN